MSYSLSFTSGSAAGVVIGRTSYLPTPFVGGVDHAYAWAGRTLDDGERESIHENPWQIFRAPSHRIWFDLGAGPSPGGVPVLSAAAVSGITKNSATPRVTLTF